MVKSNSLYKSNNTYFKLITNINVCVTVNDTDCAYYILLYLRQIINDPGTIAVHFHANGDVIIIIFYSTNSYCNQSTLAYYWGSGIFLLVINNLNINSDYLIKSIKSKWFRQMDFLFADTL